MSIIPRRFYLDDFFDDFVPSKNDMKCDIYEKEGKHHIEIDVPGFKKEDIKIEAKYEDGTLKISIPKKEQIENKKYIEIK